MKFYFCLEDSPPKKTAFYVSVVGYILFHRILKIQIKKKNQCEKFSSKISIRIGHHLPYYFLIMFSSRHYSSHESYGLHKHCGQWSNVVFTFTHVYRLLLW